MSREDAYRLATYYLLEVDRERAARLADCHTEIRILVDTIIECAKAELRDELQPVLAAVSADANGMTYP